MALRSLREPAGAALVAALCAAAVAGCGGGHGAGNASAPRQGVDAVRVSSPPRRAVARPSTREQWFAADSLWNRPVAVTAPLDPASTRLSAALAAIPRRTVNLTAYTTPVYRVGPDQPRTRVQLTTTRAPALQARLDRVPIPASAQPSPGTDGNAVVVQAATDTAWEFWRLRRTPTGFTADWAGVVHPLSTHPGYFRDLTENGTVIERWFWGVTAPKLAKLGGLITAGELAAGRIDHALAVAIPRPRAVEFAWPAQSTDGRGTGPASIPEGAHFRLDPRLNLDTLGLSPPALTLARAAQRYGIVVNNGTGSSLAFYAEDPLGLGTNPYPAIFRSTTPHAVAMELPLERLQLLRMDLRTAATRG